jgi:hypothetical protein
MTDRDLKDSWKAAGYSMEEMWFFRYNQELIEKLREKKAAAENRPKLRLIQGGGEKSEDSAQTAPPLKKVA